MSLENPTPQPGANLAKSSELSVAVKKFVENNQTLRLNRVAGVLHSAKVNYNPEDWVSSTVRNTTGSNTISIGGAPLPPEVASRWGVDTNDSNEQLLIKTAHELAHQYQYERGYEKAVIEWLEEGSDDIAPEHLPPYIQLYNELAKIGPITGLSTEPIYEEQSKRTGKLQWKVIEDITQLISAYFISDEYFISRLHQSVSELSQEQENFIAEKVVKICEELN